jgi:diguanylate cyclase (GGDEF)-like protein
MSWTTLFIAAIFVAAYYLIRWLYLLNKRVDSVGGTALALGALRSSLLLLEQRMLLMENTTKTDPQTGVGSSVWLESERWFAALRSAAPLCVAWFDLDGLKARNDTHGHKFGDALIEALARALRSATRRGFDEVFRLHTKGDEFLILLHGHLNPASVAHEIREALRKHSVSVSGGIAYTTEVNHEARAELRELAEQGCKVAKSWGGNRILIRADNEWIDTAKQESGT